MISALHAVTAVAILNAVLAHDEPQIVIDSLGRSKVANKLAPVIRRETVKPHSLHEVANVSASEHKTHLERGDLSFNYVEEKIAGSCASHFQYQGLLSNEECAQRCYKTFGCTRFSAGGCSLGCRISVPNENNPNAKAVPADGQCPTTADGESAGCMVYQLAFFHAVDQPGTCSSHYEMKADAANKADCAHACKNTAGCRRFTAEPNCMGGCRISKCNANGGSTECPTDSQCAMTKETGCTVYEVFR